MQLLVDLLAQHRPAPELKSVFELNLVVRDNLISVLIALYLGKSKRKVPGSSIADDDPPVGPPAARERFSSTRHALAVRRGCLGRTSSSRPAELCV